MRTCPVISLMSNTGAYSGRMPPADFASALSICLHGVWTNFSVHSKIEAGANEGPNHDPYHRLSPRARPLHQEGTNQQKGHLMTTGRTKHLLALMTRGDDLF